MTFGHQIGSSARWLKTLSAVVVVVVVVVALAMAAAVGCGGATDRAAGRAAGRVAGLGVHVGEPAPGPAVGSNILREDYVGSAVCEPCHAEIYASWLHSPMHEMTRLPQLARIRAPFDGAEFHFKNDRARFQQAGGARFIRLSTAELGDRLYQVTRVIGGRYREDYAGVEVASTGVGTGVGAAMPAPTVELTAELTTELTAELSAELILPVSFVFESRSFRLKGYSVMVGERPGLRAGGVWNQTCVFCHNTNPYFDSTWGELRGPGAPGYQGEVVDRLLPPDRRFSFEVTDEAALAQALARERAFVAPGQPGVSGTSSVNGAGGGALDARRALLDASMHAIRRDLTAAHFVELGIGCESCHGGSREHTKSDRVRPDFVPRSRFMRVRAPAGRGEPTRAEAINRTCARCHQVLFSRYPFTWEGGARRDGALAGGSSITSGEARDFLLGGCARQMACTTCHDPHAEDRAEKLQWVQSVAGNVVCTGCHQPFAGAEALRRHAHHDPTGAGGSCVGCHMPRKNMGLGYALTRYHRIGSPTDPARVEKDRPLECALCHADRSVGSLVADMERLWGKRYDRAALRGLYGDLGANALIATVQRGKAHEQAPAMAVLGAQRVRAALPAIARQLIHPIPLVRYYAKRAVDAIRGGQPCAVDLDRTTPEIEAAARRCVPEGWPAAALSPPLPPSIPSRPPRDGTDDE